MRDRSMSRLHQSCGRSQIQGRRAPTLKVGPAARLGGARDWSFDIWCLVDVAAGPGRSTRSVRQRQASGGTFAEGLQGMYYWPEGAGVRRGRVCAGRLA